jgi:hypothetical protein
MSDQEKNRGGRPRVAVPKLPVMFRLPQPDHERLMAASNRTGEPVSRIVRRLLTRDVRRD